jgi:hypothetical protein
MRKFFKDWYNVWIEAREAYVKSRMTDGRWM